VRMHWLVLCLIINSCWCPQLHAQEPGVNFEREPVVLPGTRSGSARSVTSTDLIQIRQLYGLSISPDGSQVAFVVGQASIASNSYRSGMFIARTSGKDSPISLGSAGMPHWDSINQWISEPPQWSKDGRFFLYRMRMRPDEPWQVWSWNADGEGAKPLTHAPGDVVSYKWDPSGQKILMKVLLPANQESEKARLERGILFDDRILPWKGMPAFVSSLAVQKRESESWVHEIDSGIERRATDAESRTLEPDIQELQKVFDRKPNDAAGPCKIASAEMSPDRRNAALLCPPEEGDPSRIMRYRLLVMSEDGQRRMEFATDSYRVTDYWWNSDGSYLYYVTTQGDGRPARMRVVDIHSGKVQEVFHLPEVLGDFSMDVTGQWIACTRETSVSPPRIAIIDRGKSTLRTLVDLNPEYENLRFSPAERISGVNRYGQEWFGHLVKPPGYEEGKRYPLIVTLYRSGDHFLLGAAGDENPIQVYASHGFAVLSFDIGRNRFRKTGDFEDYLLDWASPAASLEMAVQSLADAGIVDLKQVGLAGLSRGAEVLEYAISHSHTFQAAVESGPAARDPYFYYMAGSNWHEIFAKWGLGGWPEGESRKKWEKLAASLNADRIDTPLLVNSADSEFIASLALYTSLEQLRKPVELYLYPNELHIKNQPKHRYEIYERNLDWFRFWLKGEKDPSSEKMDQYVRWQKLRETWAHELLRSRQ
jgi:dipeptidyl aminopeptidase/acylaminoacyl peptidase